MFVVSSKLFRRNKDKPVPQTRTNKRTSPVCTTSIKQIIYNSFKVHTRQITNEFAVMGMPYPFHGLVNLITEEQVAHICVFNNKVENGDYSIYDCRR